MKLSIVDISPVLPGETRRDALLNSINLAQHAERLGFTRIWLAEHHSSEFVAGRAPEILIAAIAENTSTIKVGSGSVLLNHYSPFKVAEVFCTLSELYPGRVDLGIGRATTGPVTDFALQQDRSKLFRSDSDQQISEIVSWLRKSFPEKHSFSQLSVLPIENRPDLHVLGSSQWSALAAGELGLPYVFAGFINQAQAFGIVKSYRQNFIPANVVGGIKNPKVILSVHVVCADTEEEARRQLAPAHLLHLNLSRGVLNGGAFLNPDDSVTKLGGLPELGKYVSGSGIPPKFIGGTPESVQQQLNALAKDFLLDEIIIQDIMTDYQARLHSYRLLASLIT